MTARRGMQYPLEQVLLSLHDYFATLGSVEVRRLSAENDKPLRMVKTVLHTLCKIFGYRVTRTLEDMPQIRSLNGQAMIVMYAEINLRSLVDLGMIAAPGAATSPDSAAAPPGTPTPASPGAAVSPGQSAEAAAPAGNSAPRTPASSHSGRSSCGASPLPPTAPRPASPAARPPVASAPAAPPLLPRPAEGDIEEDDLAAQPDHFLNRIARRSGADGPQPLQSSNTVNMAPGGAGPAMGDDLREKVWPLPAAPAPDFPMCL